MMDDTIYYLLHGASTAFFRIDLQTVLTENVSLISVSMKVLQCPCAESTSKRLVLAIGTSKGLELVHQKVRSRWAVDTCKCAGMYMISNAW